MMIASQGLIEYGALTHSLGAGIAFGAKTLYRVGADHIGLIAIVVAVVLVVWGLLGHRAR